LASWEKMAKPAHPDPLDLLEGGLALGLADHVAQQAAQQPHDRPARGGDVDIPGRGLVHGGGVLGAGACVDW
jgi:acyl-coenzyme A thioesterase PaaI-like protein